MRWAIIAVTFALHQVQSPSVIVDAESKWEKSGMKSEDSSEDPHAADSDRRQEGPEEWRSRNSSLAGLKHPILEVDPSADWRQLRLISSVFFAQILLVVALSVFLKDGEPTGASKAATPATDTTPSVVAVVVAGLGWMVCATALSVFNKWLFNGDSGGLPIPMLLSTWHQAVVILVTQLVRISPWGPRLMPAAAQHGVLAGLAPSRFVRIVLPPAACYAGSLAFGNTALKYLSAPLTHMLRSAKPGFVFVASVAVGMETTNVTNVFLVLVVLAATMGATWSEAQFSRVSAVGLSYQGFSTVTDVTRILLLKKLVSTPQLDAGSTLSVFAPVCFLAMLGPALLGEGALVPTLPLVQHKWHLLANGLFAVLLNAANIHFISLASPTMASLTGSVNYLLSVVVSVWFFHTSTSPVEIGCFFVLLVAVTLYQHNQLYLKQFSRKTKGGTPADSFPPARSSSNNVPRLF